MDARWHRWMDVPGTCGSWRAPRADGRGETLINWATNPHSTAQEHTRNPSQGHQATTGHTRTWMRDNGMAACMSGRGHEGHAAGCRNRRMRPAPAERTTAAGSPVNSTDRKLQWNAPGTGSRKGEEQPQHQPAPRRAPWLLLKSKSGNTGFSCF